jgi:hypothetical protein
MTNEPTAGVHDLFEAVRGGADDAVVRLLRTGASAEATDEYGETALYLASVSDEPGMVRLLLTAGADPERAGGQDGGDLPLCGAACGGHTEVVRALLAAGAAPDRREAFGFTALVWAVVQGFTDTVEALLDGGADPDLPGPGGESPLLLAARRGSAATVRTLLAHGAGTDGTGASGTGADGDGAHGDGPSARKAALAEARRWLTLDVERELRDGLLRAYGDGYETVVRRVEAEGSQTVVVELLRDGAPVAGVEQQTGHAAVATLLEAELGIVTPYEVLAARASRCGDPGRDDWREPVAVLWARGNDETYRSAVASCKAADPLRQAFGAAVLGQLGRRSVGVRSERSYTARAVPVLRELSRRAAAPEVAGAVVEALGQQGDPAVLPEILRHRAHPDAGVRRRVALASTGLVPGGDGEAVAALAELSGDPDPTVRRGAVAALAGVDADTPEIRAALAARLRDPDADTAAEAAGGLAVRQDPRAVDALARILADAEPGGYARQLAADAVRYLPEGADRRRLERTLPRRHGT